jgi:hypothetical protein
VVIPSNAPAAPDAGELEPLASKRA